MPKPILISAGHGANDSGAVSKDGRWVEARLALQLRDKIAAKLRATGLEVVEDGSDGENQPLKKAIALARTSRLPLEIHFNAAQSPAATGTEALCHLPLKRYAQAICRAVSGALEIVARGGEIGWKAANSGQHHRLGFCEAGGVILEVCFISNPTDMAKFEAHEEELVDAVAGAIAQFANQQGGV